MVEIVSSLAEISDRYDAVFCDVWGCLHDGVQALPEAVAALRAFRAKGGKVVLLTNAPRPRADVAAQFGKYQVPDDCWDTIATSGDSARVAMFRGAIGDKAYFMGQDYDLTFFEPPAIVENPVDVKRVPLEEATGIACLGPFDAHADPEVNRPQFLYAKAKGLKLLCANPDVIVDRGEEREWCAGALAGPLHRNGPERAFTSASLIRRSIPWRVSGLSNWAGTVPDSRILCIGDGINTDIKGAMGEDLDSLFITGGLGARPKPRTTDQPEPEALGAFVAEAQMSPTYAVGYLR